MNNTNTHITIRSPYGIAGLRSSTIQRLEPPYGLVKPLTNSGPRPSEASVILS